jgi:phosphoenolpyruvate carboxykinase (diphosphate)
VEGGLPVALDKKEVPKIAFAHLLHEALHPSDDIKSSLLQPIRKNRPKLWFHFFFARLFAPK